jgi:hypothetical protein
VIRQKHFSRLNSRLEFIELLVFSISFDQMMVIEDFFITKGDPFFYGSIIFLTLCMLFLLLSKLCKKAEMPSPIAAASTTSYNGTWKSRIYENEKGTLSIKLIEEEETPSKAMVTINYSKESTFKSDTKILIHCSYEYDKVLKTCILKQIGTIDGQCFFLHFKKNSKRHPVGNLVCLGPADLCEIAFDQTKSKKDN